MKNNPITLRSFSLGIVFSIIFAIITVYACNVKDIMVTATQIPVLPYILLIFMVFLLNPFFRLIRIVRPFSHLEIMIVFIMGMVSASLSTFGLTEQLIPLTTSLFNREWNNAQSEWNRYIVPFFNDAYFLSEPGVQEAAVEYHQALMQNTEEQLLYDSARYCRDMRDRLARVESELKKVQADQSKTAAQKNLELTLARATLKTAQHAVSQAEETWKGLGLQRKQLPPLEEVLRAYPALILQSKVRIEVAKEKLNEVESKAFAKVELFRRGLPADKVAFPGFLPRPKDDSRSYFNRLHRFTNGKLAVRELKAVGLLLKPLPPDASIPDTTHQTVIGHFASALDYLEPLTDSAYYEKQRSQIREEYDLLDERRLLIVGQLKQLRETRHNAMRREVVVLEGEIDDLDAKLDKQKKRRERLAVDKERCDKQLIYIQNVTAIHTNLAALKGQLVSLSAGSARKRTSALLPAFVSIDASLKRFFLGDVPWSHWIRPLARWSLLIGLTFAVLMTLNLLIFRQWAYNENLTYPLAELPRTIAGGGEDEGRLPLLFRSGLFWTGLAVAGTVMGWNLLCYTEVIPGLIPFDLSVRWWGYINHTKFAALSYSFRSPIFFTMIGLAFIIPKNISFSLWFFFVIYIVQLLFLCWAGYGQDVDSFPFDWWHLMNFRTAQGQGALIIFSSAVLYKCRKYLLCGFMPETINKLDRDEQIELRIASMIFIGASIGVVLVLWRGMGANIYYTIFCYFMIIIITIGLVRAVTEGGLLSFQAWCGPFHFIRAFFGFDKTWSSATLFAPLLVYYSIFFLDIKPFIAPAMANAIKLRADFKIKRTHFHIALIVAMLAAAVTAIIAVLIMSYANGADSMNGWFYARFPRREFDAIRTMIKDAPPFSGSNIAWVFTGGISMAVLLFLRQYIFWLPHPIGMIMLVNPIMNAHWFSIFIGWMCNVVVTKYGHKDTYRRARGFFIGLIVGEVLIVALSLLFSMQTGKYIPIQLDKDF